MRHKEDERTERVGCISIMHRDLERHIEAAAIQSMFRVSLIFNPLSI